MPRIELESSPSLSEAERRLRGLDVSSLETVMATVGLERPGAPIRVALADERTAVARRTPDWVAGFADATESVVVIFPARIPNYPDPTLEGVYLHEIGHILIARAAGGREVPRWLNEGLAMIVGNPWDMGDRGRLALTLLGDRSLSLEDVDRLFNGGPRRIRAAYALAGAFTQDLLRRHGPETGSEILRHLRRGASFDVAFERATGGVSQAEAEASFWRRYGFWYRWLPIVTSSGTLWSGISILALLAIRRRRQRDAELRARWLEEEHRARPTDTESGSDPDAQF